MEERKNEMYFAHVIFQIFPCDFFTDIHLVALEFNVL